jgi:predicted RNase H-like nuclease
MFIGVDLGWYGKPSGLASIVPDGEGLRLRSLTRLESVSEIVEWIRAEAGTGSAVVGVDAPLVIPNATGIRSAERELNRDFRRFHAGCHAANLGRPFAPKVLAFSKLLEDLGFAHGANMTSRQTGRFQIEVHPHAATVSLFGLDRIVKYKRGRREARARELSRLRRLVASLQLPGLRLPSIPRTGNLKPAEDQIDAVICAFVAAHWWHWTTARSTLYGAQESGYIVVPRKLTICGAT